MIYDRNYYLRYKDKYDLTKERKLIFRCFLRQIKQRCKQVNRILDIGCAYGYFLRICDQEGVETYGIDISKHALREGSKYTRAKLYNLDVNNDPLPFEDNFFDVVTFFEVLEHLMSDTYALSEAYRVLSGDGLLFAVTPNGQAHIWKPTSSDPTHINVHDKNYWARKLRQVGFEEIDIKCVVTYGFPPFPRLRALTNFFLVKPIFFPLYSVGSELFIFGKK